MAKIAEWQFPDGRVGQFEFPDGTTEEQAQAGIQQMLSSQHKLGAEAFPEAMKSVLSDQPWWVRQLVGSGTALRNAYEGGKQIVGLDADQAALAANKVMAQEAPVASIAGNMALFAPLSMVPGANTVAGSALLGSAVGALQPAESWTERAGNAALGGGLSAGGQAIGGVLGNMAATKAAQLAAQQSRNLPRDSVLAAARQEGMIVPPSSVNPSLKNRILESISGKIATAQSAANKNQDIANALSRRAVGMSPDEALTSEAMQRIRKEAFTAGYEPVAAAGKMRTDSFYKSALDKIQTKYQGAARSFPDLIDDKVSKLVEKSTVQDFDAGDAIKAIQILRDEATEAFRKGDAGLGQAKKAVAKALEDQIERGLSAKGQAGQELLQGFRDARKLMAKAHTVEDAIVEGSGDVSMKSFAKRVQAGKPMSDELKTMGEFANLFPRAAQSRAQVSGPDVHNLKSIASMFFGPVMGGGTGFAIGGPTGAGIGTAVGSALPFLTPLAARSMLFRKAAQDALIPSYAPSAALRLLGSPETQQLLPGALTGLGIGLLPYVGQ